MQQQQQHQHHHFVSIFTFFNYKSWCGKETIKFNFDFISNNFFIQSNHATIFSVLILLIGPSTTTTTSTMTTTTTTWNMKRPTQRRLFMIKGKPKRKRIFNGPRVLFTKRAIHTNQTIIFPFLFLFDKCMITVSQKVACDWNRTGVIWNRLQPLSQLYHNLWNRPRLDGMT